MGQGVDKMQWKKCVTGKTKNERRIYSGVVKTDYLKVVHDITPFARKLVRADSFEGLFD